MIFIKRFFFVLILLVIAFFVYRMIHPVWAASLLYDLKSFSNSTLGTDFVLFSDIQNTTGAIFDETWIVLDVTGILFDDTGSLQEISGDELLLHDVDILDEPISDTQPFVTWTISPSIESSVSSSTQLQSTKTTKPVTTIKWLSHQDIRDAQNLLENFQ